VVTSVFLGRLADVKYDSINPIFFVGLVLVAAGAWTVLTYAPKPAGKGGHGGPPKAETKPLNEVAPEGK
jgi:hypothetical protein